MPLLQVRDFPEDLYDELARMARQENRSIAQETIVLLRSVLKQETPRIRLRQDLLARVRDLNLDPENRLPDPAVLIREDRNR